METKNNRGTWPQGWRVVEGGRGEHSGSLARRRIKIRPQLVAGDASDLLDVKDALGGHAAPLVNGAMGDPKSLRDLEPKPAPRFPKKLLNRSHAASDSTTNKRRSSEMLGVLCGKILLESHNALMAKVKTHFKPGKPRHFVREWRKWRGYTLEKLAEIAGVTHGAISQLERGKISYTQGMLEALGFALSCSPGELVNTDPYATRTQDVLADLSAEDRKDVLEYVEMVKLRAAQRAAQKARAA